MAEPLVPKTLYEVRILLDLFGRVYPPKVPIFLNPVRMEHDSIFFDFTKKVNWIGNLSDCYIPTLPDKSEQVKRVTEKIQAMLFRGTARPAGMDKLLFECIDQDQFTSEKLTQEVLKAIKQIKFWQELLGG